MPGRGHNLEAESQVHPRAGDSQLCPNCLCHFLSRTLVSGRCGRPARSVTGWVEGSGVCMPEGKPRLLLALRQLWVNGSPISRAFGSLGEGTVEATGTRQGPSERVEPGIPLTQPRASFLQVQEPRRGAGIPPKSARALPWRERMCLWTTSWKPAPCSPWAYTLASRPESSRSHQSHRCHQRGRGAWTWEGSEGHGDGSGQPHPATRSL